MDCVSAGNWWNLRHFDAICLQRGPTFNHRSPWLIPDNSVFWLFHTVMQKWPAIRLRVLRYRPPRVNLVLPDVVDSYDPKCWCRSYCDLPWLKGILGPQCGGSMGYYVMAALFISADELKITAGADQHELWLCERILIGFTWRLVHATLILPLLPINLNVYATGVWLSN